MQQRYGQFAVFEFIFSCHSYCRNLRCVAISLQFFKMKQSFKYRIPQNQLYISGIIITIFTAEKAAVLYITLLAQHIHRVITTDEEKLSQYGKNILNKYIEKAYKYNIDPEIMYINFQRAFDSIKKKKLIRALINMEIAPKLIRLKKLE